MDRTHLIVHNEYSVIWELCNFLSFKSFFCYLLILSTYKLTANHIPVYSLYLDMILVSLPGGTAPCKLSVIFHFYMLFSLQSPKYNFDVSNLTCLMCVLLLFSSKIMLNYQSGVQWLSGRVLVLRLRSCGFNCNSLRTTLAMLTYVDLCVCMDYSKSVYKKL